MPFVSEGETAHMSMAVVAEVIVAWGQAITKVKMG